MRQNNKEVSWWLNSSNLLPHSGWIMMRLGSVGGRAGQRPERGHKERGMNEPIAREARGREG